MELVELEVEAREQIGGSTAERLRRGGKIPGVMYAEGREAKHFIVQALDFQKIIAKSKSVQLYRFKSGVSQLDGKMVLIKQLQIEPLKEKIVHIDCLEVKEGHRIHIEVPLELTGEVAAVKSGDAILIQNLYQLDIECLPTEIPSALTVDISALSVGDSLHARDVTLPAGVKLKSDEGLTLVSIVERVEEVIAAPVVEAAATPGAEGAAAGAEGAAPAAAEAGKEAKDSKK